MRPSKASEAFRAIKQPLQPFTTSAQKLRAEVGVIPTILEVFTLNLALARPDCSMFLFFHLTKSVPVSMEAIKDPV